MIDDIIIFSIFLFLFLTYVATLAWIHAMAETEAKCKKWEQATK